MDLAEHYYDDNFDYYEENSREGIMKTATTEPVKSFLHGEDHPEKDKAFEEWNKLRQAHNDKENRKVDQPWLKPTKKSDKHLRNMARRYKKKEHIRLDRLEANIDALDRSTDTLVEMLLHQANQRRGHASSNNAINRLLKYAEANQIGEENLANADEKRVAAAIRIQRAFRRLRHSMDIKQLAADVLEVEHNVSPMLRHRGGVGRSYNEQSWRREPTKTVATRSRRAAATSGGDAAAASA